MNHSSKHSSGNPTDTSSLLRAGALNPFSNFMSNKASDFRSGAGRFDL
jgi:hypothetical protein